MAMTEKEKMLAGEVYSPFDPELMEMHQAALRLVEFYLYLCHVLLRFTLVLICNTKISEKSDMAKS